jgi:hypothetical protein
MKFLRTALSLPLFLCAVVSLGCLEGPNANSALTATAALENVNAAKSNIEELGLFVNIPYETEDIVWKESTDRKQITAVLLFSKTDANELVNGAASQNVKLSSETWFPAELIAQSEMSGDDSLNGLAYSAEKFYQEPYTSGRIVRVEATDYFILELSAK